MENRVFAEGWEGGETPGDASAYSPYLFMESSAVFDLFFMSITFVTEAKTTCCLFSVWLLLLLQLATEIVVYKVDKKTNKQKTTA